MRNFHVDHILGITKSSFSFLLLTCLVGCDIDTQKDSEEERDRSIEDKEDWEDDWEEDSEDNREEDERENLEELWNHCVQRQEHLRGHLLHHVCLILIIQYLLRSFL